LIYFFEHFPLFFDFPESSVDDWLRFFCGMSICIIWIHRKSLTTRLRFHRTMLFHFIRSFLMWLFMPVTFMMAAEDGPGGSYPKALPQMPYQGSQPATKSAQKVSMNNFNAFLESSG